MSRYAYRTQYTWNADIAYLAGLIASDGCMINDGRHINITSKDYEIIEHFKHILSLKGVPRTKLSGYGTSAYCLQFSNVALYDLFLNAGITPAKSKTIGAITVPYQFYGDFLRGYFDGDGTVYGYWDRRWANSLMYYTGYASASPAFLSWLQCTNKQLVGTSLAVIKPNNRVATLTYAKKDSKLLFDYMYKRHDAPRLMRKYNKFIAFLAADPYAK